MYCNTNNNILSHKLIVRVMIYNRNVNVIRTCWPCAAGWTSRLLLCVTITHTDTNTDTITSCFIIIVIIVYHYYYYHYYAGGPPREGGPAARRRAPAPPAGRAGYCCYVYFD